MRKRDALLDGSASRQTLPFLPTLAMACLIGGFSLLCREPAAPAPQAAIDGLSFHAPAPLDTALPRAPASLAFAAHYPLVPAAEARLAAAPTRRAARLAARSAPRPCLGPRCGAPAPSDPFVAARPGLPPALPAALPLVAPIEVAAHPAGRARSASEADAPIQGTTDLAEAETETGGLPGALPDLALPFAPAARAAVEAAAFVRTGASALGGSVTAAVTALR